MNPYFINEPAAISFSGGRTSAFMLYKILEAHDGVLPDDVKVTFANTGKEMPQTLDFVQRCSDEWGVDIVWLELSMMANLGPHPKTGKNQYEFDYTITDYEKASRSGEPFDILLDAMPAIPNIVNMACTAYLKTRLMRKYAYAAGLEQGCVTVVGLRYDEPNRVKNTHNQKVEGFLGYCPLYVDLITKEHVAGFWGGNNFDLELPSEKGVTAWGNCDICYKKSIGKRASIIRERPDLADWWINAEKKKGQRFRQDQPSYEQMKIIATDQGQLFDFDDESIPCFCGD